ncbi:hypothetical protein [Neorhizobium sp. T7_12]|uniref:hypothetical protein n=1 Tax=Neorhizobium sp. T7_12 TaxID=2093832 RepID=UPI000CF9CE65|nr:hypothetical protein [Neorhizobium sp. T7_12]
MPVPGFEWLTNYLQAIRLFNVQAGLIYTGVGSSVTALNYFTSDDASPDLFADKTWPIMALTGIVITAVDLGRIGVEYLKGRASDRAAAAYGRRQREDAALAVQLHEEKIAEVVIGNMWAIEDTNLKRVLKYILQKPDRRFTSWGTNVWFDDLLGKKIVRKSAVEDGFYSNGTFVVHPAIWEIKDEFLMKNKNLPLAEGKDYVSYRA